MKGGKNMTKTKKLTIPRLDRSVQESFEISDSLRQFLPPVGRLNFGIPTPWLKLRTADGERSPCPTSHNKKSKNT